MADINLSTSIDAIKTKILNSASSATVEEISSYARAARAAGLDQDSAVETAINDRVTALASTGTAEEVRKLAATINQIRNAPVTSSILNNTDQLSEGTENLYYTDARVGAKISTTDISELTDTTGLLGSGGITTYTDMSALTAATGMSTGDQAFVQSNNNLYIYNGTGWYKIATVENLSPTSITGVNSTYDLASDGTPTVITAVSTDPEGFPLTWSYQVTSGTLGTTATVSQSDNVFTITPSTLEADAGTFEITFSATDGVNGVVNAASSFTLQFTIDPYYSFQVDGTSSIYTVDGVSTSYTHLGGDPNQTRTLNLDVTRTIDYIVLSAGSNNRIELGPVSFNDSDFTWQFFFFGTTTGYSQYFSQAVDNNVKTLKYGNGSWYFYTSADTSSINIPITPVSNAWYHIIIQGDYASGTLHAWKDTVYQGSTTSASAFWGSTKSLDDWSNLILGGATSENFQFGIGEMKIFREQVYTPGSDVTWAEVFGD